MKMEYTECSETSAYKIQTPGNYPEENIQHRVHGESFKSRKPIFITDINNGPQFGPVLKEANAIHTLAHSVLVTNKKNYSSRLHLGLKSVLFSLPIPTKNFMSFSKVTYITFDYLRPKFHCFMR